MIAALGLDKKNEITEMCSTFDKFNIEIPYNHLNVTIDNK